MNTDLFRIPNECPVCGDKTLKEWSCQIASTNVATDKTSTARSYRCAGGHVFMSPRSTTAA